MAGRAEYDAGSKALDVFAQFMMNRQAKKEARAERLEEESRYEKSLIERERRAEERAARQREQTPVERKVYQGDNDQGPPELLAEELNSIGAPVRTGPATQREKQDYSSGMRNASIANDAERLKLSRDEEDRQFKREGELSRRANDSRRTNAAETRANRPDTSRDPSELSKKEALAAISSFEYRADKENGETWQDVAERGGVDVTSLLKAANLGAQPKEPGAIERGLNAVGGALKNAFSQKKAPPVLGSPGKKEEKAKYPDGTRLQKGGKVYVVKNGVPVLEE